MTGGSLVRKGGSKKTERWLSFTGTMAQSAPDYSATSTQEAEKYQAISEVWKEVAEMYRQENEDLKQKMDRLKRDLYSETTEAVESLNPRNIFNLSKKEITLKKKKKYLQLPSRS